MSGKFGRMLSTLIVTAGALLVSSPVVYAAEALPGAGESYSKALFAIGAMIAAGLAIGIGGAGVGLGMGTAVGGACNAVGRNPGVQGKVMMTMMIGLAMAESVAIYALVIALVLLFASPYARYFLG
jgi:F-type H+-transporting ATPase subunit c